MTKKPIFIGIAGDSASGKHTFFGFIQDILGSDNISIVNGDDYHKWPRRHPKWDEYTHLHPDGNDLGLLLKHALALASGESISKCIYDHEKGDFINWEEVRSKRFITFVGLHTLHLEEMRALMDLCLYMSPREDLRRYWKIRRDQIRGSYTEEEILQNIRRRLQDGERYIHPQREHAHLTIHYYSPKKVTRKMEDPNVELRVKFFQKGVVGLSPFLEYLSSCATLKMVPSDIPNPGEQGIDVSGSISAEEVKAIAKRHYVPYLPETSDERKWRENTQGVCQLAFLQNLFQLHPFRLRAEEDRELSLSQAKE